MQYHSSLAILFVFAITVHTSACLLEDNEDLNGIDNMSYDDIMTKVKSMKEDKADVEDMAHSALFMNGSANCLGIPKKFFKVFRFLFKPHSADKVNVKFYLMTRKVRKWKEIPTKPSISFKDLDFDANRHRTIFIVHGFLSKALTSGWVDDMADALLNWGNVNIIAVDWNSSWKYWRAVANTRVVGIEMTKLGIYLTGVMKADPMKFHLIGHSLGAHIVSYMATCLGGVARITGLDPASPCFQGDDLESKLDKSDAKFVDVIHTNGRILKKLGLGQPQSVGHVDFYPNGGMIQPGCKGKKINFLNLIFPRLYKAMCSHGRSHQFFIEGIRHNCTFWGHTWEKNDDGTADFDFSQCTLETCTEMGMLTEDFPGRGTFYVTTREKIPFCNPNNMIDKRMGRLLGASQRYAIESENNLENNV